MLVLKRLEAWYGTTKVLHGIDLAVEAATVVGVLGRNGVGKTTTVRAVFGQVGRVAGSVTINGQEIAGRPSHQAARSGIGLVPQGRGIFPTLSVEENLQVTVRDAAHWHSLRSQVFDLFPDLADKRAQSGGSLSGGQQAMLALARAIVAEPDIVIMDEPTEGLSPIFVATVFDAVTSFRDRGVGVLLIEQDIRRTAAVADEVVVLEKGEVIKRVSGEHARSHVEELEALIVV